MVTKGHRYLKKPAAEILGFFKCAWPFGTTWYKNELKKSKVTNQNEGQNLLKV